MKLEDWSIEENTTIPEGLPGEWLVRHISEFCNKKPVAKSAVAVQVGSTKIMCYRCERLVPEPIKQAAQLKGNAVFYRRKNPTSTDLNVWDKINFNDG